MRKIEKQRKKGPFYKSVVYRLSMRVLYHSIQFDRSRVTGLPVLSKCHTCPGSQVPLTKSSGETKKKNQKTALFGPFWVKFLSKFLRVTGHNPNCQIHNFVRPVTGHTSCRIELNGTVHCPWAGPGPVGPRAGPARP